MQFRGYGGAEVRGYEVTFAIFEVREFFRGARCEVRGTRIHTPPLPLPLRGGECLRTSKSRAQYYPRTSYLVPRTSNTSAQYYPRTPVPPYLRTPENLRAQYYPRTSYLVPRTSKKLPYPRKQPPLEKDVWVQRML